MYAIFLKAKKERKFFPLRPCQRSTESHWWVIAKTNKTVPHRGDSKTICELGVLEAANPNGTVCSLRSNLPKRSPSSRGGWGGHCNWGSAGKKVGAS